jgi:SAM-dependent methyltransferase
MTADSEKPSPRDHWQGIYDRKLAPTVSWFQATPQTSLDLIHETGVTLDARIVDIGGGASTLVDHLLAEGFADLTVLDIATAALDQAQARLGDDAAKITWCPEDVTVWVPGLPFDLWHDRAVFHFLTDAGDRAKYRAALQQGLKPGGWAIIATFALDGPERCSGLPVVRYSHDTLATELGAAFSLVNSGREEHVTPGGTHQNFVCSVFRKI